MALHGTIKVVYEKVSAILHERGNEFSWKYNYSAYGTVVSFYFQLFSSTHIFFVLSPVCVCNAATTLSRQNSIIKVAWGETLFDSIII